jgi:hypothetical protein
MITNPQEECPPDEIIKELTIKAKCSENGTWIVSIPEIKFQGASKNLTRLVSTTIAEIEEHNEELLTGDIAWQKDEKKKWETTHGGTNHDKAQRNKIEREWAKFPEQQTYNRDLSQSIHCW